MRVAIVHDYLTQRGGAERVVLAMLEAFPQALLHTTLYEPAGTFAQIEPGRVRASALNGVPLLRRSHRLAFPLLAPVVSRMRVDADVALCSSSGWAHGVDATGAKVVYCHSPARWLYQRNAYVRHLGTGARVAAAALREPLVHWDQRAARTASRYVVNSTHVAQSVRELYGFDAEVLPPPPGLVPGGDQAPVQGPEPGFVLCVSRLLPYKNVDAVVRAFRRLPGRRLVVAGEGPDRARLESLSGPDVAFVGRVDDAALRWLYANASALVSASYEDYGLTPLEAAAFGKPAAVLRYGGFLDTLVEGETGAFFDRPVEEQVAAGLEDVLARPWDADLLRGHAGRFSKERFVSRLQEVVAEAAGGEPR